MRSSSTFSGKDEQTAFAENQVSGGNSGNSRGEIAVVGIGPGSVFDMSPRAKNSIVNADVIVGYTTYLKLVRDLLKEQEIIGTGMRQEVDRCNAAVERAMAGKKVAVISSGDPGIYGMAGLVLEIVNRHPKNNRPEVKIIPGISAAGAAAAVLGAPLMHDFAVISLSDLLTPWELIKKRVEMAAMGDFVIALYNPKSHRRVTQIQDVQKIILKYRLISTPVGIVNNASREAESMVIADLGNFTEQHIDMFSLVIIGNSKTYVSDGKMITPRGYML